MFDSSCPRLSRASTSRMMNRIKDMDGRDKPGHDEGEASNIIEGWYYTWAAYGLESVVTWTLSPTSTRTHLRMEQSGFRPDQQQAYQGAKGGGQQFFAALEQVLARID